MNEITFSNNKSNLDLINYSNNNNNNNYNPFKRLFEYKSNIITTNYKFQVYIIEYTDVIEIYYSEYDDYNNVINNESCITIRYLKDSNEYIYLKKIKYGKKCSKNKKLEKKVGTVEMANSALELCNNLFPDKKILIEDESKIHIHLSKTFTVNICLPECYTLLYGITWYMKYFKFDENYNPIYFQNIHLMNEYLLNNKTSLNTIFFYIFPLDDKIINVLYNISSNNNLNNISLNENMINDKNENIKNKKIVIYKIIKYIYNKSENDRDFLLKLYEFYGFIIFEKLQYEFIKHICIKLNIDFHLSNTILLFDSVYVQNIKVIQNDISDMKNRILEITN
jgi:hypothetical protein